MLEIEINSAEQTDVLFLTDMISTMLDMHIYLLHGHVPCTLEKYSGFAVEFM